MPLPKSLVGAAAKMAVTKMIERGWLEEGLAPVGPVVIQHLAGALGLRRTRLVAPGRIVFHPIGRVGHHQERLNITEQPVDRISRSAVAADETV